MAFEHIDVWGSRTQKRWFAWQALKLASQRTGQPIVCAAGHELATFPDYPCACGARDAGVKARAQTPAAV